MRPALSRGAPVCSASVLPNGLACTPAAQTLVAASIRSRCPSLSWTTSPCSSTSTTSSPSRTPIPRFSRQRRDAPPAALQGGGDALHPGRDLRALVVAEVRVAGAGRDDEGVVRRLDPAAQDLGGHHAALQVDVGDLAEDDPGVLLAGQDLP